MSGPSKEKKRKTETRAVELELNNLFAYRNDNFSTLKSSWAEQKNCKNGKGYMY